MREPNAIDRLPADKVLHCLIGCVAFSFLSLFSLPIAIIGTLILGIGIEIYQKVTATGQFEMMDAVAVWIGGVIVMIPQVIDLAKFL